MQPKFLQPNQEGFISNGKLKIIMPYGSYPKKKKPSSKKGSKKGAKGSKKRKVTSY